MTAIRYHPKPLPQRRAPARAIDVRTAPTLHYPMGLPMPCDKPGCDVLHWLVGYA